MKSSVSREFAFFQIRMYLLCLLLYYLIPFNKIISLLLLGLVSFVYASVVQSAFLMRKECCFDCPDTLLDTRCCHLRKAELVDSHLSEMEKLELCSLFACLICMVFKKTIVYAKNVPWQGTYLPNEK